MIKERDKFLRELLRVFDVIVIIGSFVVAYLLRELIARYYKWDIFPAINVIVRETATLEEYLLILTYSLPLLIIILSSVGSYRAFRTRNFLDIILVNLRGMVYFFFGFMSVSYLFKMEFISRLFIFIFCVVSYIAIVLERCIVLAFYRESFKKGMRLHNIILVGTGDRAREFVETLGKHESAGIKLMGIVDRDADRVGNELLGYKVMGTLKDMERILTTEIIDEVVFIVPRDWLTEIEKTILLCETLGIKFSIAADFYNLHVARGRLTEFFELPIIRFETTRPSEWKLFIKRFFDFFISLAGLILLSPLFVVVGILIKLTSPGPVFFRQTRCGLNGRKFTMYKFRSMRVGAEKEREKYASKNIMEGPVFKMIDDPRATGFGKFLRKTSIDELPQLFNVLMGDMSLVGPRPPIPEEVEKYELWQRRRLSMRPGITCLWQISGRSTLSFKEWMELDLTYIDNWSLELDFKILLRTIPAVLMRRGAR